MVNFEHFSLAHAGKAFTRKPLNGGNMCWLINNHFACSFCAAKLLIIFYFGQSLRMNNL